MKAIASATALAWILLAGSTARAQLYSVTSKLSCYDGTLGGPARLDKTTYDSDELAAFVLGFPPSIGPLFALVLDSEGGDIGVVQRCDGAPRQAVTDLEACEAGGHSDETGVAVKLACTQNMVDWGATSVDGKLLCLWSQKAKLMGPLSLKGSCEGAITVAGAPCWLQLKVGKPFEMRLPCPK